MERAARLLSASDRLRRNIGSPLTDTERSEVEGELAAVRAALGDRFQVAWDEGFSMSLDKAIALAADGGSG